MLQSIGSQRVCHAVATEQQLSGGRGGNAGRGLSSQGAEI